LQGEVPTEEIWKELIIGSEPVLAKQCYLPLGGPLARVLRDTWAWRLSSGH